MSTAIGFARSLAGKTLPGSLDRSLFAHGHVSSPRRTAKLSAPRRIHGPVRAWGGSKAATKKDPAKDNSKVMMSEFSGMTSGAESIILSARRVPGPDSASSAKPSSDKEGSSSFPAAQVESAKDLARKAVSSVQSIGAQPPVQVFKGAPAVPVWALAAGGAAILAVAVGLVARRGGARDKSVDALARRGFIPSDRSVKLELIQGFEDPTQVRDYKFGNARLVELEPLSPLSEEKMQRHREQRRREHGWKKPEHTLVEGEPLPEGVDPMTVRFIPKKHPFALSADETDEAWSEDVARRRLRQRRGRPEKEQQRSRAQLDRLRKEMDAKDAATGAGSGDGTGLDTRRTRRSGVLPSIDD